MPSSRESPFNGSRFVLREDSRTWSNEPNQSRKMLHFASTASTSSDSDEPEISPPLPPSTSRFAILLPTTVAIMLLAIAFGFHLAREPSQSTVLLSYIPTLPLFLSTRPHVADYASPAALTPALRTAIEEVVRSTLRAHDIARRAPPDYALQAHGSRVAKTLTSGSTTGLFSSREDDPSIAIDDDVHAGKCWQVTTLPSQLGIRLSCMVYPTYVTVEHLPAEVSVEADQAPKTVQVWGVVEGIRNEDIFASLVASGLSGYDEPAPPIAKNFLWAPLASFTYNIHADNPVQTFPVSEMYTHSKLSFGVVAVVLLDNWGGNSTCLYRVRVHGTPA
ncbi:UNC-like C-terminal-domain-containing protein [Trametes meyenii]|nr:UNC-like C-terminal-domain-containing protein [Trametes meyenii]